LKKLIIISGATATGKTSFSLKIADLIKNENLGSCKIINFDSLLFYKELNIGTAKPSLSERNGHEHLLIDITSAKDPINAHQYVQLAEKEILQCHNSNTIPILVGGSAFYLRALIKGMYESTSTDDQLREEVDLEYKDKGIKPIIDFLLKNDPKSMEVLHENDHYRIIRAYEYFKQTGKPLSSEKKRMDELNPYDLSTGKNGWQLHSIYLDLPKEEHWSYITQRTEAMIKAGLVQEVEELLKMGFTGTEKPLRSIGYLETLSFLKGEFKSTEDYQERISISTRQLAKSQRTFFKKITPKLSYHPLKDEEKLLKECREFIYV
jgi:tRNA dimethylallyltransferase